MVTMLRRNLSAERSYRYISWFRQVRGISNYIRDVIRTGSLSPENPLVKALDASKPEEYLISCFPLIREYHVQDAVRHVKTKQAVVKTQYEQVFCSSDQDLANNNSASEVIHSVVQAVNNIEEPAHRLRQICAMMMQCRPHFDTKQSWKSISASVSNEFRPFQCVADLPTKNLLVLHSLAYQAQPDVSQGSTNITELEFASRLLLSNHRALTGVKDISQENEEDVARYFQFSDALEDVENRLLSSRSTEVSPTLLSDVYNVVGLHHEQSKLLGFDNVLDHSLSQSNMATRTEIQSILDDIEQMIVPKILLLTGTKSRAEKELEAYLSPTSSSEPRMSSKQIELKKDEFSMMKLEEYVTLDGALEFLFQLLYKLSGVSFRSMEIAGLFDSNTFVFGAYCEGQFLGTLVINPYRTSDEAEEAVSIPVFVKSANTTPLVCLSLSIHPPTWDGDPIRVTWDDCESLFHEMGHCLQLLCGQSEQGCILGPELLPGDVSEFLPKFLEHWLMEESTIHAMVNFSQSSESFSTAELETAFKVRSRTKMFKLSEQAFRSSLEIALFSDFNLKGNETMMDLQVRLAEKFIPYGDVEGNDLEPVFRVLESFITRRQTDQYRYLWSDCASASVFKALKRSYGTNSGALEDFRDVLRRAVLDPGATADFRVLLKQDTIDTLDLFELYKIR